MTNDGLALRVAALKVLLDYLTDQYAHARSEAAAAMKRGERLVARSPLDDDQKIAVIPKSDPKPIVTIVDETALTAWMLERYPASVDSGYQIVGSTKEVVTALFTHAPHLLKRSRVLNLQTVGELKATAAAVGQPIGPGGELDIPGIEVRTPEGVVSCRPSEGALAVIRDLHDRGVLELDGTMMKPREVTA